MTEEAYWCEAGPDWTPEAIENAVAINPANAPAGATGVRRNDDGTVTVTQSLTGIAGKFWPIGSVLRVAFTNGNDAQRARVMEIASGWSDHANVQFERVDDGNDPTPDIRVSFDQNRHWSRVGTDSRLSTEAGNASMEFIGFNPGRGTVLHEFGHALGLKHEHQNPSAGIKWDKEEVYNDLGGPPNNWSRSRVDGNVFSEIKDDSLNYSRFDPQSVMGYTIRASWTTDGFSMSPGSDLSPFDISGIGDWYPFGGAQRPSYRPGSDDVRVLTRGVSGRMFERRWDGRRWEPHDDWDLALEGDVTGHPGVPGWNSGSRMAVVSRSPGGMPVAAELFGGGWRGWTGLGGEITGSPTVIATNDAEWCFVRGASGRPFFKRRELHGAWSRSSRAWLQLGGEITGGVAGDAWRNTLALAVRGSSGQAAIKWWDGSAWRPGTRSWIGLTDAITAIPAIGWQGDALHVVARFPDGEPHHLIYDTRTRRVTRGWTSLGGGIIGSPTLVCEGRDVMHLLVRGTSRRTFRKTWRDGAWSEGWENLGGQALDSPTGLSVPGIGAKPTELHVFVTGVSRGGFRKVWNGTTWTPGGTGWEALGGRLDWGV